MSLINKEIGDFAVQAYQNEAFRTVTKADVLGNHFKLFARRCKFLLCQSLAINVETGKGYVGIGHTQRKSCS